MSPAPTNPLPISPDRERADLCPGLLRTFAAEDGQIVRLRAPGGRIATATLQRLSRLSPAGFVQLTSRGNLQLRALPHPVPEEVRAAVLSSGLLPSASHERVRNIVCSPLTGLAGGLADVQPLVTELDRRLCADPELAELPGRFLFVLDDGRGDVITEPFDLAVRLIAADRAEVRQGGHDVGLRVPPGEAVGTLLELARRFQRLRSGLDPVPWQVRELASPVPAEGLVRLPAAAAGPQPEPGVHEEHLVVGLPLGRLTPDQADALAAVAEQVVLTPWRSIVIPVGAGHPARLAAAGLSVDPDDPWGSVSACTGRPGCARSAIATLPLAREVVDRLPRRPALPVHLSGCERRCGAPRRKHHDLVAPQSADQVLGVVRESRP